MKGERDNSLWKRLLQLHENRSKDVERVFVETLSLLREHRRCTPRVGKSQFKRLIHRDVQGRKTRWTRRDKAHFVKETHDMARLLAKRERSRSARVVRSIRKKRVETESAKDVEASQKDDVDFSWRREVRDIGKLHPDDASRACVKILRMLRANGRRIPPRERLLVKSITREARSGPGGATLSWSRVDKPELARRIRELAEATEEDDARDSCARQPPVSDAAAGADRSPPAWLGVMRGVELLSTTNAAPIKRVVEAAMEMGGKDDMSLVDIDRLEKALTSVKKGGTYKFNNGRCLKQTVLAVLSTYVAKYASPVPYTQLSLSLPVRRERKSTTEIDRQYEAGTDWRSTLAKLCGMVCNNARPVKRLLRIAAKQSEHISEVHASVMHILRNTPCESNSCSLIKREIRTFLQQYDASAQNMDFATTSAHEDTPEAARPSPAGHLAKKDNSSSAQSRDDEEVLLAVISTNGNHEYAMKCDRNDLRRIFQYMSSIDRSPHASEKFQDALGLIQPKIDSR